jgi:DNA-directed RNA polymerase beta subunit
MESKPKLTPVLVDAATKRQEIRNKAVEGLKAAFPMKVRDMTIELLDDVKVHAREFGPNDQKQALLQGASLNEPVKGTLVLKDGSGREIERSRNVTLLHLPYFTERHSFIVDGNEYQVSNQIRMKPGVYTRRRANEELEAAFNLSKGSNFRLSLDPRRGLPLMEYGTTTIPLYPILRKLGVPHQDIANAWGHEVAAANQVAFDKKHESAIDKLYGKLVHPSKRSETTLEGKLEAINKAYAQTKMDPDVNHVTLGSGHDKVTASALLDASKKILNVYKSGEDVDDRDSLAFKTFYSVDDFVKERIGLDARTLAMKVKMRSTNKTSLKEIMPSAPFSTGLRSFLTGSQLSSIPTQINPMELIDHAVKVTTLGEGGISSERAIPMEARQLHPTHFGLLDPIRTPESFKAGVDIRVAMQAHRDEHGNLYTPVKSAKDGKFTFKSAKDLQKSVVAFPGQVLKGVVAAMKNGQVQHVPMAEVDYVIPQASQLYSPTTNLIPMLESIQGNRGTMGSKMQTQALPLVERETPLVQVGARIDDHLTTWERELGKLIVPTASHSGKVVKIDSQYIYIDPSKTKKAEDYVEKRAADAVKRETTIYGAFDPVSIRIELEKGDKRTGVNKETGEKWEKTMHAAYGYVPYTAGEDGEAVDIYLANEDVAGDRPVIIVHQLKKDGASDEDKVMIGFADQAEAVACYKKHVPSWCYGSAIELSWSEFNEYLDERRSKKEASAKEDGLIKIPYETNFPFASKTYLHHDIKVKVGDHVSEDETLADSNFTREGELALGKNMTVAYMAYYGLNSNDAVVISEGAAKKLTSEHMYKEVYDVDPDVTLGREIHRQYYGNKYTAAQYNKLTVEGVVKKGQKVLPHDLIIAGVRKGKLSSSDTLLGNFKKTLATPYREETRVWEHDFEGEVIDVYVAPKRVVVTIKTREPMRIGDKLSGRYGNKGVISHIVPDGKMIQDEAGSPIDILYTSAGVISRINPAQVLETALGKVAKKTGKPIVMENFSGRDNVKWAKGLLKEHGVKDKETVFDPVSGKKIPGVMVGPQYTLRLFKTTDSNFSARGTGGYDVNMQPTKGGTEGAKGVGQMEFNALVAHNARNVLKETSVVKSQKNDEFWRAAQLGLPLPALRPSFAYDKFIGMLHGAGIKVDKKGSILTLGPLTDADVMKMSRGAIENDKLIRAKDLHPERGGFFDPAITGGDKGTHWSHVNLAEPVVNPVFVEPVRRLLGMTNKELEALMVEKGGAHIKRMLNQIDIPARMKELRAATKVLTGTKLDDAVKQLKYLAALQQVDLKPGEAYVLSKLPVLPPIMRPILPGKGGQELVVGDSNYLYQNAFLHNKALQTQNDNPILPPDEHQQLRKNLFTAVGAVIGTHDTDNQKLQKRNVKGFIEHLTGKTTPKSSFFQKKLMKRQQDMSGRGTIAPDGSLHMDEVGLPEDMIWEMFGKFAIARLVRRGFGAVQAKEMVENRHPAARDALLAECKERPVMVNRAPSLHRYNIVGAYAVPVAGKTIRVNPFIEKGMNADYDGDTFQVHAPVTPLAVAEVKNMTLSNLIFGDKQKNDLMVAPSMEAVMGVHLATLKPADGKVHKFKTKADAMAAYKAGKISLNDKIEVG